jgi:nucleotide-binding universal stress UspA family protein
MSPTANDGARRPLLICYDASEAAVDALEYAAALLPGSPVLVLTVWKPMIEEALSPAARPPVSDPAEAGAVPERSAEQVAAEGARRASAAGLNAEPLPAEAPGPLWETVERVAEEHGALLVVCGTNRTKLPSAFPGSFAHALVSHLSSPIAVVPSAKAAAERRSEASEKRRGRRSIGA